MVGGRSRVTGMEKHVHSYEEALDQAVTAFFGLGSSRRDRSQYSEIRKKLTECRFENGEDICLIDGRSDSLYFLLSGVVQVLNREGEQINLLREGQYFGEYGVLSGQKRLSTVRSMGRTVLYRMDREDVLAVLRKRPALYGEFMKRVYTQVSGKHRQILELSRARRGILQHPSNRETMSRRRMLVYYGPVLIAAALCAVLIPEGTAGPVFLAPLLLMFFCVLVSKRTVESLVAGILLAAVLLYRGSPFVSFTDAMLASMGAPDNVFTVYVMAMMGGVTALAEATGAVTAFQKYADRTVRSRKSAMLLGAGIMAATAIDDSLNMLCGSFSTAEASEKQKVPRESLAALFSILPVVLCSFLPVSLWGVFVFGTLAASAGEGTAGLFVRSIPFNFYSGLAVLAMLLFCAGKLPPTKPIQMAEERVKAGGELWPAGSEDYLVREEPERWGRAWNVLLPILFLGVSAVSFRSFGSGRVMLDSACALSATVAFQFFLYGFQELLSPEEFLDHLCSGIAGSSLPVVLYLLTICFASLLDQLGLGTFLEQWASAWSVSWSAASPLFPAGLFLFAVLLTVLLGSSWSMFAMVFPLAVRMAPLLGLNPALCAGAVMAAGIAGEQNCVFTANATDVGTAVGCNPAKVLDTRLSFSIPLTAGAFLLYLAAGFVVR